MGIGNTIGRWFRGAPPTPEVVPGGGRHIRGSEEPATSVSAAVSDIRDEFTEASTKAAEVADAWLTKIDEATPDVDGHALILKGAEVLKQKTFATLSKLEDPVVMLELQTLWQQHKLQNVKETTIKSLVQLAEGQRYLQNKCTELKGSVSELEGKASVAIKHGRDDLARQALAEKVKQQRQIAALEKAVATLQPQLDGLVAAEQAYAQRVKEAKDEAEMLKIRSHVADAQIRMGEATGDLALGVKSPITERARSIIESKEARAGAWGDVISSGKLEQIASDLSPAEQELNEMALDDLVDQELAALKTAQGQ